MNRKIFASLGVMVLVLLIGGTAFAAPLPQAPMTGSIVAAPSALSTTFKINVVFVGYSAGDINMTNFDAELPATYDPIVRGPAVYGINMPLDLHGDYTFNKVFADSTFNDNFFAYLASTGKTGTLTAYQDAYNQQVHKSLTVPDTVLYIDAPSTERWLMNHGRSDLGLDIANYTIFFVNWYGRSDFQFHVYTKTDASDPDTGYNFGALRASRKMIAWGGSYGRSWFYDLSAGPEAWTSNYDVDNADIDGDTVLDYRMPPVWEYGNVSGYRPFDNLSGDLGKVLRWVAVDLLFTTSPLYDPLASEPFPGMGKRLVINMFEDDPKSQGTDWIDLKYIKQTMSGFQKNYRWNVDLRDQKLTGSARRAFRIASGIKTGSDCWDAYGTTFAELFCYFDANRNTYLAPVKPGQDYSGGVFAFNTTAKRLGSGNGLLGYADDDWVSGAPSYVFEFDTKAYRTGGYGFSTTTTHEFGHHLGMSHPHDGYDSTAGIDFDASGDYMFAWSGDESHTIMTYIDVNKDFGWFDRDNMNRFLTARYLARANQIAAQVQAASNSRETRELLSDADATSAQARGAFQKMDYETASAQARAAFERVWRAAQLANLNVPMVEPLPQGGPRQGPKMVDPIRFPDN